VYLRDFRRLHFLGGVLSLGDGRAATVQALRDLTRSLGVRRTVCYGNSGGAFAAMLYGLDLAAEAVLAVSGTTNLSSDFNTYLRSTGGIARVNKDFPDTPKDLRRIYAAAERRPRVLVSYGEYNWDDRIHAEHVGDVPGVTLRPVEKFMGHNAAMELVRRGEFQDLLDWLLSERPRESALLLETSKAGCGG
jgi:hypothetical protein